MFISESKIGSTDINHKIETNMYNLHESSISSIIISGAIDIIIIAPMTREMDVV